MAAPDQAAAAVAALEVAILSVEGLSSTAMEEKRYHVVAWIDPGLKLRLRADRVRKSTFRFSFFPLRKKTLEDSAACVKIEVFYSPRIPFHRRKLIGSGALPISSSRIAAGTIAVPIRSPNGVFRGVVTVSARIFWDLGFGAGETADLSFSSSSMWNEEDRRPTAPPLLEDGGVSGHGGGSSWLTLAAGASAAAVAVIIGVAFRRNSS
ncbi:uncharacterized protein LOC144700025 [Wolffia australiana]